MLGATTFPAGAESTSPSKTILLALPNSSPTVNDFKNYMKVQMTHKNLYTGLIYAETLQS